MDIWEAIEKRRTVRRFLAPPTDEQLERLLDAGSKAPSAGNRQAWFVIIVRDSQMREKLGEINKEPKRNIHAEHGRGRANIQMQKDAFNNCATLTFYTYAPEPHDDRGHDAGSVWLLVENLCLGAVSEKLGAQIVTYWDDAAKEVNRLLSVPDKFKLVTCVNLGVPHPEFEPPKKVLKLKSNWIFCEKWPTE